MARLKIDLPRKILSVVSVPVRITDLNYGNHVGNDSMVSILHEARVKWITDLGYSELELEGVSLILAGLAVEFIQESFYGDELIITLLAGEITGSGFEIFYVVHSKRNEQLVVICKAKTEMVCYDYNAKKIKPLPEAFKKILLQN